VPPWHYFDNKYLKKCANVLRKAEVVVIAAYFLLIGVEAVLFKITIM
jgi:hypothetical protein